MIKPKLKECFGCKKPKQIWKNFEGKKWCAQCWNGKCQKELAQTGETVKPTNKKHYSIPSRSSKKIAQDTLYSVARKLFLDQHPSCMIAIKGVCTGRSSQIHHTYSGKDREKFYLDTTTWLSTDDSCHKWVHEHSLEARELGFLK